MVISVLFGYAHHHIRRGSPLLTTLTEAVFPFYIIHQTAIVLTGHFLSPYRLPALVEAWIILSVTAISCLAGYGLARAIPHMRLLLGLKLQSWPTSGSSTGKGTAAPSPAGPTAP